MVKAGGYARERPSEDEFELYRRLRGKQNKGGYACGVHDPDFTDPLDGTLHLEKGLRYSLRLECEDESLNFSRSLQHLRIEPRDDIHGCCAVALVEDGSSSAGQRGPRIIVADNSEERDELISVLERLKEDPRSFKRGKSKVLLGGCLPACAGRGVALPRAMRRRKKKPRTEPPEESSADFLKSPSLSRQRVAPRELQPLTRGMSEAFEYARQEWDKALTMRATKNSGSRLSFRLGGGAGRRNLAGGCANLGQASSPGAPGCSLDALETDRAGILLARFLGEDTSERTVCPVEPLPWKEKAQDLFAGVGDGATVEFADFWALLQQMLLARALMEEPALQKYFAEGGDPGMTLEKWRWFLVQIQDEPREAVEAAEAHFSGLALPDMDKAGRLSIYGLSRYLCSSSNSITAPERLKLHCDMTRPLTDYWISGASHIHADIKASSAEGDGASGFSPSVESETQQGTLLAALQSGCRCIGLALAVANGDLVVLMQEEHIPFSEALQLVSAWGFKRTRFPLCLSLHLGLLPVAECMLVPRELVRGLGDRLWTGEGSPPSPEQAQEKIVVMLAPAIAGFDPSLDEEPLPALRSAGQNPTTAERAEALEAWQSATRDHAIWPGQPFDPRLRQQLPNQFVVNYLPCDELRSLSRSQTQQMIEYHRQYLTVAFPLAPRRAPLNFNPGLAWSCGAQVAALTLSATGDGAVLAHCGRFAEDNGGCGYVLKPPHLRGPDAGQRQAGRDAASVPEPPALVRLDVRIVAARAVPGQENGPEPLGPIAVAVSVWGAPSDCARQAYQPARPVGAVVTWPEAQPSHDGSLPKPMAFAVSSPATAVLAVELLELDGIEGGQRQVAAFATPVDSLRQGYRWVPLWASTNGGDPQASRYGPLSGLLAHIVLKNEHRVPAR